MISKTSDWGPSCGFAGLGLGCLLRLRVFRLFTVLGLLGLGFCVFRVWISATPGPVFKGFKLNPKVGGEITVDICFIYSPSYMCVPVPGPGPLNPYSPP